MGAYRQAVVIKDRDKEDAEKGRDRRRVQRTRVLRNAKIIVPRRSPVIHCTVQNITGSGACLKLANTATDIRASSRVRWKPHELWYASRSGYDIDALNFARQHNIRCFEAISSTDFREL